MKKLFEERNHVENLLNTRFNFFLVIFASIIASSFAVENPNQLFIILLIGAILETLLALVIYRSERKLGLYLKEIYKDKKYAASKINIKANQGILNFSMRKIIGYLIPFLVALVLIIGTFFYSTIFDYLNTGKSITITNIISNENRLIDVVNEIANHKTHLVVEKVSHPLVIGFVAVVISLTSLIVVVIYNRKNDRVQKAIFQIERNLTFEGKLSDGPDAFEFYGVDLDEAKKDGITKDHITYLVLSINTLSSMALYHGKRMSEELEGNTYRERMFEMETTRKAWKYAKRFFGKKTNKAIDNYIKQNSNKLC